MTVLCINDKHLPAEIPVTQKIKERDYRFSYATTRGLPKPRKIIVYRS